MDKEHFYFVSVSLVSVNTLELLKVYAKTIDFTFYSSCPFMPTSSTRILRVIVYVLKVLCSGMFICHVSRHEYANMSRTMECLCACHDGLFGGIVVVEECFLQTSNAIVK